MRIWCHESQRIDVGDLGIYFVCALCMDLVIDADIMKTYLIYTYRFLDQLYNVDLYQNRVVQLKCEQNAGQKKSVDQRDHAALFPGNNVSLLKRITVSRSQKENVKTFQGIKVDKVFYLIVLKIKTAKLFIYYFKSFRQKCENIPRQQCKGKIKMCKFSQI